MNVYLCAGKNLLISGTSVCFRRPMELKLSETMKIKFYPLAAAAVAVMSISCTDIVPQAYDPGLSVDIAAVDFRYAGGSEVVKITSNNPWTLDMGDCSWVTPSITSGESTEKVILTAGKNPDAATPREATITVTSDGSSRSITVSQERNVTYIEIKTNAGSAENPEWTAETRLETESMFKSPTQNIEVQITSNAVWTIDAPEWIKASASEGGTAGDDAVTQTVTLTVDNTGVSVSDGSDYLTAEVHFITADETATLEVRQQNSYSNCYVVNEPGTYTIPAGKPDGTPVNASSVTWMFESENGLISGTEPKLENGKITFTVAESGLPDVQKGGYGIITLMNGSEVAYSYAIWYTKEVRDIKIGNNIFMDRNLMAWTDNLPAEDFGNKSVPGSYGCLYQWGCKNPIPCPSEKAIANISKDRESQHMNKDMFTEDYLLQGHFNTGFTNPDGTSPTYYVNSNSVPMNSDSQNKYPWLLLGTQYDLTQAERWSETRKTVDDPCPAGYKVPSIDQLEAMYSILGNSHSQPFRDNGMENWSKVYTLNGVTFSYMNPGIIQYNKKGGSKPWRDTRNTVGSPETYHSSSGFQSEYDGTPGENNTICCQFLSNRAVMDKFDTRAAAAVRCVKM